MILKQLLYYLIKYRMANNLDDDSSAEEVVFIKKILSIESYNFCWTFYKCITACVLFYIIDIFVIKFKKILCRLYFYAIFMQSYDYNLQKTKIINYFKINSIKWE